jgi:exodeoxyribonuclease VII small subunit
MGNMTNNTDGGLELDLPYEEAFDQLEHILQALESGDLPLEEALSLYEQGAALAAYCARLLDEAELRVEQWQPDGSTMPMEGWQES